MDPLSFQVLLGETAPRALGMSANDIFLQVIQPVTL